MGDKPKPNNSRPARKDSGSTDAPFLGDRTHFGAGSAGRDTGTGPIGDTTGPGIGDYGTGPGTDASADAPSPTVVNWEGIDYSHPLLTDLPPEPERPKSGPAPAPKRSGTSKGKLAEPPIDPATSAAMVMLTANGVAMRVAGYEAAMRDDEYDSIHKPLTAVIEQSKYAAGISKYSAPFALLVAAFGWIMRVGDVYRAKHPPKPKLPIVHPPAETPGQVIYRPVNQETTEPGPVMHTPGEANGPVVNSNGMTETELADIAAGMSI